ncbi:MAG: hypothetical protein DRI72_00125 [Bacteroidetes bacterium]|nr:MAG: hypothetical protein DRI72_00125 [Bacteroidota bacterium]
MEKEDRIIKNLLDDKFTEKAPEGFTGRVMDTLEAIELQKQKQSIPSDWPYLLVVAGAALVALGILSFIDSSFIPNYYRLFFGYVSGFFQQLTNIFSVTQLKNTAISTSGQLVIGTLFIMLALLLFDSMIWRKRRYLNLFLWV